jgi:hypothetical protein
MPSPSDAGGFPPEGRSRGGPTERHEPSAGPAPGSPEETLHRLEQRLDRASEAAERLMAQVAAEAARGRAGERAPGGEGAPVGEGARVDDPAAGDANPGGDAAPAGDANPGGDPDGAGQPPPAGWQTPEDEPRRVAPELDPFVALVQAMRDLVPSELQQRLIAAVREVLLALRALIDWYLERIDRRRDQGVEVQDIPIL